MKLHLYTNNAYDTVALINDEDQVVSTWDAATPTTKNNTALTEALTTTDPDLWDNQGDDTDVLDFEDGNELFLIINDDGSWETPDKELLVSRLDFHLGANSPIVKALSL